MNALHRLGLVLLFTLVACRSTPTMPSDAEPGPTWEESPELIAVPTPTPMPPRPEVAPGPPLVVRIIDVGQGDGMLIISPTRKAILIDAGDVGNDKEVLAQLEADGITTLDLAIMSHPHADHIGGMQKVLAKVPTKLFMDPGFDQPSPVYSDLLAHLERTKTPLVIARAGRKIDIGGGATLVVLLPAEPLLEGTRSDANANSIVLKLTYGGSTMLFTGDAEAPTEDRLIANMESLHADVLKVAHHGSRFSTQDGFLAAVDPAIAVISCGRRNSFGHPAPAILDKLERAGVDVFRTDTGGTITLTTDGVKWRVTQGTSVGVGR